MFKRLELPDSWHQILQEHAHTKGVLFLSSVADHSVVAAGTIVEGVALLLILWSLTTQCKSNQNTIPTK